MLAPCPAHILDQNRQASGTPRDSRGAETALALVVFATWRPLRVLLGAWLFGGMTILQLQGQALGLAVPSELLPALPHLATLPVTGNNLAEPAVVGAALPANAGEALLASDLGASAAGLTARA